MNSDLLGKAAALHICDETRPLTQQTLQRFINHLFENLGCQLVSRVIQNGMFNSRHCIAPKQWNNSLECLSALRNKSTEVVSTMQSIFRPFSDDYLPTDIISEVFTYLDHRSHSAAEVSNRQLCSIGRQPSSNLHFGRFFEYQPYAYESAHQLMRHLSKRRRADFLKYSKIRKAVMTGESASIDISKQYCNTKHLVIAGAAVDVLAEKQFDWPYPTDDISNLQSLVLRGLRFDDLSMLPSNVLGCGDIQSLEIAQPLSKTTDYDDAWFFKWFLPESESVSGKHHFSNLKTLKLSGVPWQSMEVVYDIDRIEAAFPQLIALEFSVGLEDMIGSIFLSYLLNAHSHRLESLHFNGVTNGLPMWQFVGPKHNKLANGSNGLLLKIREICFDKDTIAAILPTLILRHRMTPLKYLEKTSINLRYSDMTDEITFAPIAKLFSIMLESQSTEKYFNFNVSFSDVNSECRSPTIFGLRNLFESLYIAIAQWITNQSQFTPILPQRSICIRIRYQLPPQLQSHHMSVDYQSVIRWKEINELLQILTFGFIKFKLSIQCVAGVEWSQECTEMESAAEQYRSQFITQYGSRRERLGCDAMRTEYNSTSLSIKSKDWQFVEAIDGKWITNCERCHQSCLF